MEQILKHTRKANLTRNMGEASKGGKTSCYGILADRRFPPDAFPHRSEGSRAVACEPRMLPPIAVRDPGRRLARP